jgi:polyisoprenoid-binding protein YceI
MNMKSRNWIIAGAVIVIVGLAAGFWLYNWVLGDTQAPSGPISAIPVGVNPTSTSDTSLPTVTAPMADNISTEAPATDVPLSTETSTQASSAADAGAGLSVFLINQNESQVQFSIYEELRGSPKTVIGVSNQVAGEAAVDFNDLSKSQLGVIQIDARTLKTDDNQRNRAIGNRILHTDQYEYITFTPTQLIGLSGSTVVGQSYTFQIAGDLTIQDVTQPVMFDATVKVETPERLSGTAKTTIQRGDYNLIIPNVPFVANAGEEVTLEINFVLTAK